MNENRQQPETALMIVGSHTTAIAAELAAKHFSYSNPLAIIRRQAITSLKPGMDGESWAKTLKTLGFFGSRGKIQEFTNTITALANNRPFDCFIHHSKDPFSQLLVSHPLCRKYFYLEEGFTALTGTTFGRFKKRSFQKALWRLKSHLFYGGRINRYRSFFDTTSDKFGGVCAITKSAFKNFPHRIQLIPDTASFTIAPPAQLILFLDSQYFLGNCTEENYATALLQALSQILRSPVSAAIKFHPGEKDASRKRRIFDQIEHHSWIESLIELPSEFVGERMTLDSNTQILVGTSAIGYYLGERGFPTYTIAARLASSSERFAQVMKQIPQEFLNVCKPA